MLGRIKLCRRGAVLLIAAVATAISVGPGLAGDTGNATRPIERYNDDCGSTQGKKVIGKATYKRSGNILSVIWTVHGADPGNYWLFLYEPVTCGPPFEVYLGKFRVDASGHGQRTASADVSGQGKSFFACDQNAETFVFDCSLLAKP